MTTTDFAANLSFFLLTNTGTIFGVWKGKLNAQSQKNLMGRVLGRGTIVINGTDETVLNRVSVCFGQDWDDRNVTLWRVL